MNHYCANSGLQWITTVQTQAPNESLLCRRGPQMNHYCADSAPNELLLCRRGPQINHYCADSGFQYHYSADSGPKWITTGQSRVSKEVLLLRLRLQMSLAQDGSVISGTFWFQLSTMEANRDMLSIFFYSLRNTVQSSSKGVTSCIFIFPGVFHP